MIFEDYRKKIEKNLRLVSKGKLKNCDPPIKPYNKDGTIHGRTCRKTELEPYADKIANLSKFDPIKFLIAHNLIKPTFTVDSLIQLYLFYKYVK